MTHKPLIYAIRKLTEMQPGFGELAIWGTSERVNQVLEHLNGVQIADLAQAQQSFDTLVVVGGGTRMDAAKAWRVAKRPDIRLILIPSIWGSGAEASCVVVQTVAGKKEILIGEQYLPDIRSVIPSLMDSLSDEAARFACGDAWSHALEGFLSPLADHDLRSELSNLLQEMSQFPLGSQPGWFELSARACQGQAKSSVGLIHGIAHSLEGPLQAEHPEFGWRHARLCAGFLYPVSQFNRQASGRFEKLFAQYSLDPDAIVSTIRKLYSQDDYDTALPALEKHWSTVLRDPCTRTNSTLVRSASLAYFSDRNFL